MHDLVTATSHALSHQDAEQLERLLEEVRTRAHIPVAINVGELARASRVLSQQVQAAERHLGLSGKNGGTGRSTPWEL